MQVCKVWFSLRSFVYTGRQLVKADNEDTPIAEFHPHKRHFFVFRMSQHAFLEIKPDPQVMTALEKLIGQSIWHDTGSIWSNHMILVSFLLVERRRRDSSLRIRLERS